MAGSLAMIAAESLEKPDSAITHQWRVTFSRYIINLSLPSTSSSLVPAPNNWRSRSIPGYWISSDSPTASLQLVNSHSCSDAILSVCFNEKIFEEHYVSKLQFTWPQVACVSGCPPRGSRAVFVSYKDLVGEIQKFALRFSVTTEAETFIKALKDILRKSTEIQPMNSDFRSELSSQSVFLSTNRSPSRACDEASNVTTPSQTFSPQPQNSTPFQTFSPQLPLRLNYEVEQEARTEETPPDHNYEVISSALPPSFASFLTNCCSEVKEAATQPTSVEDFDFKSQIAKCMEDSSFQGIASALMCVGDMGSGISAVFQRIPSIISELTSNGRIVAKAVCDNASTGSKPLAILTCSLANNICE
ncbi:hypothetical protein JCGZ_17801 [Jatropha curcas]|uniref:Poor homologous synapsis 1 PH domain-containing protein n=1 Tax=Jatropha curcas TaxID=180498 RepID=A0A067JUY7_JATCU|nr:hypothetical protein JCGZ_17801 [Jatropha curcas]